MWILIFQKIRIQRKKNVKIFGFNDVTNNQKVQLQYNNCVKGL